MSYVHNAAARWEGITESRDRIANRPAGEVVTHDYRRGARRYGWDIAFMLLDPTGKRLSATGFGKGIRAGDFVLLSNGATDTRYRVEDNAGYFPDPADMWHAHLTFSPRDVPVSGEVPR